MSVNYNDGKWHGWNGGECPVHPRSFVEISWRLKDGDITGSGMPDAAECWFWNGNDIGDIIAFRVIKEHKEPREFYAYHDSFGNPHVCEPNTYGATLFREVAE